MKAFVLFYVLGRIWDAVGGGKNANELKGARVVDSRNVAGRKWEVLEDGSGCYLLKEGNTFADRVAAEAGQS